MAFSFDKFVTGLASGLASNKGPIGGFGQGWMGAQNAIKAKEDSDMERAAVQKILSGDDTGWQEWGGVNPQAAMSAWNNQQRLKQGNSFGVGSAKGEYAQLVALEADPNIPNEYKEGIKRRKAVLEKDPEISYVNSYSNKKGSLEADLGLGGIVEQQKTLAREKSKNKAEVLQKEENLKRNMPSLYKMADELIELADKATYTKGGVLRDSILRQLDLPMSEGGIAREKYDEIVKNELLPKLRETYGGQLSDSEREALLGTLGNVNLSPAEKKQAVRAFIEAKERQLKSYKEPISETKEEIIDWSEL